MKDLAPYLNNFSESGKRVLESSYNETRRREQYFIAPEHILYALMKEESELFNATMHEFLINPQKIQIAVEKRLENIPQQPREDILIAPDTTDIFRYSMEKARSEGRRTIEAKDICYILATAKYDLLKDILQNPENPATVFKTRETAIGEQEKRLLYQLEVEPSSFFTEFSLRDLVNKNTSTSGLLFPKNLGGAGIGGGGGNQEQFTHTKHESLHCPLNSFDSDKFNEEEFIASLKKDLEEKADQNGLKVIETNAANSSSFHIEYKTEKFKGRIDISGAVKNGYYELKAMIVENGGQKAK